jgi:predicted nucleotide-binding protein
MKRLRIFLSFANEDEPFARAIMERLLNLFRDIDFTFAKTLRGLNDLALIDETLNDADILLVIGFGREKLRHSDTACEIGYFRKSVADRPFIDGPTNIKRGIILFNILQGAPAPIEQFQNSLEYVSDVLEYKLETNLKDGEEPDAFFVLLRRIDDITSAITHDHNALRYEERYKVMRDVAQRFRQDLTSILTSAGRKIFVVHGRDQGQRHAVASFLKDLGFEPIVLHERPNRGRSIISKFREEAADVVFAVVLMTPDDQGGFKGVDAKPRPRQNVVFELGFFIGAFGPERVAALVKGDIEKPSDYEGVAYISLDEQDWQAQLARELTAVGLHFRGAS